MMFDFFSWVFDDVLAHFLAHFSLPLWLLISWCKLKIEQWDKDSCIPQIILYCMYNYFLLPMLETKLPSLFLKILKIHVFGALSETCPHTLLQRQEEERYSHDHTKSREAISLHTEWTSSEEERYSRNHKKSREATFLHTEWTSSVSFQLCQYAP